MNTLTSNPKKTMFYAAAQNMLNSNKNLKHNLFQLVLFPSDNQNDQLYSSLSNYSDGLQSNQSFLKISNIISNEKYRSISNKLNCQIEQKGQVDRLYNAYNQKRNIQLTNENSNRLIEKEQKKLELKKYLLKQIEEKKNQQIQEQERKRMEDEKAEQLVQKQLKEIKARYNSKFDNTNIQQQQGSIWKNPTQSKAIQQQSVSPQKQGIFMKIYQQKQQNLNSQQSDILQRINHLQNDINSLQYTQQSQNTVNQLRNNIKLMMKKQISINPEQINKIKKQDYSQLNDRYLDCETIFIPVNQQLNIDVNSQYQYENTIQEVNKQTDNLNQNSSFQNLLILNNISTITNQINNNSQQQVINLQNNQIINHSRLTISELSQKNRSQSNDKYILSDIINPEYNNNQAKIVQTNQKRKKSNLQLKLPHRTTMLMQIHSKNSQIQTQKSEEPKSSKRN